MYADPTLTPPQAWFVKMKVSNAEELSTLLDAKAYAAHIEASKH